MGAVPPLLFISLSSMNDAHKITACAQNRNIDVSISAASQLLHDLCVVLMLHWLPFLFGFVFAHKLLLLLLLLLVVIISAVTAHCAEIQIK